MAPVVVPPVSPAAQPILRLDLSGDALFKFGQSSRAAMLPGGLKSLTELPARWLGLQVIILVLFAPWALYAAGGFLSTAAATPIRLLDFLHIYWTVLTVGIPVDVAQFNWLTLPALAIFLVAVAALAGRIRNYELGIRHGEGRVARGEGRVRRPFRTDLLNTDLRHTDPLRDRRARGLSSADT